MNAKLPIFTKADQNIRFKAYRPAERNTRVYTIPIAIAFLFLIFIGRLFHLTVVKGTYYGFIAENNRIREISLEGKRGTIYDRKGLIIAESLENSQEDEEASEKSDSDEVDPLKEVMQYKRVYTHPEALAHILGYRLIASEEHLEDDACAEPLAINDRIGVAGIEGLYECHLRAIKGKRLLEVDSLGKGVRVLSQVEPHKGGNLQLSIDADLQQKAYEVIVNNDITTSSTVDISEQKIAVVALDPHTGEVLLMHSYPTFDPTLFESQDPKASKYFTDKDKPLFNRSLLGTYPPGSVFKPMIAAAALEEGAIDEYETIEDNGFIEAGPSRFHNWLYTKYGRTDGLVDVRKGLQRSNDIYFYKIGEALTPEKIKSWSNTFGFGKKTGIALTEASGVVPSDFWKRENIGERWFLGDTYNLSIGQGYLLTTPMQVAHATMPFANGGKLCTPQVLKLNSEENADLLDSRKPECIDLGFSEKTLTAVRDGMKQACETGGTAWPFFNFRVEGYKNPDYDPEKDDPSMKDHVEVGCKTGTAESHQVDALPHAWFTVFAPYNDPEILITVMAETAGEGSEIAAPIAKEILTHYFERTK